MWQNMLVIGNFAVDGDTRRSHYWTSSKPSGNWGHTMYFYNYGMATAGNVYNQQPDGQGGNGSRVRAVRNF